MFKFQEVSYVIYFYSCSRSSGILIGTKEVFMMSLLVNKTVVVLYLKKKAMQIEWLSSFRCLVLSKRHFLKWQLPKGYDRPMRCLRLQWKPSAVARMG